jgi:signal transduction histidine kinase
VKEFVELHGGTVTVGAALEGGAAFTVSLPLRAPAGVELRPAAADAATAGDGAARAAIEELRPQQEVAERSAGAAALDERPLVLVVEDNQEMNRFIAETLSAECRVAAAYDGRDGLDKAVVLRPDAILSDVMMPGMSGEQLLRAVRAREELAGVPFLVLTARADDEARVRLLEEGAQDYLVKPFSTAELRARLGNQLATKRARDMLQQELASQSQDVAALAAEVATRNRELSAANQAERQARAEADKLKDEFFANLSHDLRTPVAAIKASIGVVLANEPPGIPEPLHRMLTNIDVAADRMGRLVGDLLELTRLKAGRVQPQLGRSDLRALALRSARAVDALLQTRGQYLELQAPTHPVWAWADAERLERALLNLLSNAYKYGRAGGTVRLTLEARPSEVVLAVTDDGPGISEAEQNRIFERYYRPQTEVTERTQGSGLGLAIARAMVELQGGRIWVESRPGDGTTFCIAVPRGAQSMSQPAPGGARPLALSASGSRTSS